MLTTRTHWCLWALLCAFGLVMPHAEAAPSTSALSAPGNHDVEVMVNGVARHYLVHTPAGYDGKTPMPLVVFFHGLGGSASQASRDYQWPAKADKEHFIVAFMNGVPLHADQPASFQNNPNLWRDIGLASRRSGIDDFAYVMQALHDLKANLNIDAHRIYATGFSNGGGMTFAVGSRLNDQWAAIAPVSTNVPIRNPQLIQPLPTIYFIGDADPAFPLTNTRSKGRFVKFMPSQSIPDQIAEWVKADGCAATPIRETKANGITCRTYAGTQTGSEVVYYEIAGNGHHWPGGHNALPAAMVGSAVDTIDATDVIWDFFSKHMSK